MKISVEHLFQNQEDIYINFKHEQDTQIYSRQLLDILPVISMPVSCDTPAEQPGTDGKMFFMINTRTTKISLLALMFHKDKVKFRVSSTDDCVRVLPMSSKFLRGVDRPTKYNIVNYNIANINDFLKLRQSK